MPKAAFVVKGENEPIGMSGMAMLSATAAISALCLTLAVRVTDGPTTGECQLMKSKMDSELVTQKRIEQKAKYQSMCKQ